VKGIIISCSVEISIAGGGEEMVSAYLLVGVLIFYFLFFYIFYFFIFFYIIYWLFDTTTRMQR